MFLIDVYGSQFVFLEHFDRTAKTYRMKMLHKNFTQAIFLSNAYVKYVHLLLSVLIFVQSSKIIMVVLQAGLSASGFLATLYCTILVRDINGLDVQFRTIDGPNNDW